MKTLANLAVLLHLVACGDRPLGTSVRVSLAYDDALGLDGAEVILADLTESGPISHELLLVVPDELAGGDLPIEVWGHIDDERAAYGTGSAVPVRDATVAATVALTACRPGCDGDTFDSCTGPPVACALGCSEDGEAHCIAFQPSNDVDPALADPLRGTTTIAADTTFDTDTGAVTGGVTRAAGSGVARGIAYVQAEGLGIFAFHNLTIEEAATVRFTGARAAVVLVGGSATLAGTIDVAADHATPGPGGGAGGRASLTAQGCGPGGAGSRGTTNEDSGGGGGGAGRGGGAGGTATSTAVAGGTAGVPCLAPNLEPLQGGSGGGAGGPGATATVPSGGGGGGALQITALGTLELTGTINAAGAGGDPGPAAEVNSGSGAGGGSGGAILIEASSVIIRAAAILAANGGAGGGGVNATPSVSTPGENGRVSRVAALGGASGLIGVGDGGNGGASAFAAQAGKPADNNGGGGGGAVGAIVIRGRVVTLDGIASPDALLTDVVALE
jgi:hypothetical protein